MIPEVRLVAGTLHRNHPFVDAVFNDAMLFSRPIEQGFNCWSIVNITSRISLSTGIRSETFQKAERFDVGYAGRVAAGHFSQRPSLLGPFGGAQYSEARTFFGAGLPRDRPAGNNLLTAFGPQFFLSAQTILVAAVLVS